MQWNLANFLPGAVKEQFAATIAGYLSAAYMEPERLPSLIRGEISQKLFQSVIFYTTIYIKMF